MLQDEPSADLPRIPRHFRLDIPGLLQHVIARGIEQSDIFRDDVVRSRFVARLGSLLAETEADCFASPVSRAVRRREDLMAARPEMKK